MSFQEKSTWAMLLIVVLVYGWYFVAVFGDLVDLAAAEVSYRPLMFLTVVVLIALTIGAHVVLAVSSPGEADTEDERDREINRFGEYVSGYVLGTAAIGALFLAVFEVEHFWIANALLAGLVLSEVVASVTKIVLYRRGW